MIESRLSHIANARKDAEAAESAVATFHLAKGETQLCLRVDRADKRDYLYEKLGDALDLASTPNEKYCLSKRLDSIIIVYIKFKP